MLKRAQIKQKQILLATSFFAFFLIFETMEIVVDIGNTFTKVAGFSQGVITEVQKLEKGIDWDTQITIELLRAKRGIISSVAGGEKEWFHTFPEIDWLLLNHDTPLPFKNRYETPHTLGLDRMALAAAASTIYPHKDVLIIDAGTCVTYELVTSKNNYQGGAISPGLKMRLRAMHHFTAKLPDVSVDPKVGLIGNTTESCLQSGALHGLVAELEGTINSYKSRFKNLTVVLTGGDAEMLAPLIKNDIFARQNFLLEGLHAVLAYNSP